MGLYDNAWPSTYEEIKRFYPVWYQDVLEMDAIWRTQGVMLDGVRTTIESLVDNSYILTADPSAIAGMEEFLHIIPDSGQTLEERRQVVKTYVLGLSHIGAPEIKSIAHAFTDGEIIVGFCGGEVQVKIVHGWADRFNALACKTVLLKRIPAHLSLLLIDSMEPVVLENHQAFLFAAITVILRGRNKAGLALSKVTIRVRAVNRFSVSAGVTVDLMWRLDGTFRLDGTRQLNASKERSEL